MSSPKISMASRDWLSERNTLTKLLYASPYDLIIYIQRSIAYENLGFFDLTAGDAYRALLLTDEVQDDYGEYHEKAKEAFEFRLQNRQDLIDSYPEQATVLDSETARLCISQDAHALGCEDADDSEDRQIRILSRTYSLQCYQILTASLAKCGCQRTAFDFCTRGLAMSPADARLLKEREQILRSYRSLQNLHASDPEEKAFDPKDLPDSGFARRELYPWNKHEPDRFSERALRLLNAEMGVVAPKCEVRATDLPLLTKDGSTKLTSMMKQLGVFALADIAPGELLLSEVSLLTANNRLHESFCDACSSSLPTLDDPNSLAAVTSCPDCDDILFCNNACLDRALALYHPAVCGKDVDALAKDTDPREAANALYLLLLVRALAMSETQSLHPLELKEVKYIWGDFVSTNSDSLYSTSSVDLNLTRSLPFSFNENILAPIHVLEKMDIDIFAKLESFDTWVLNTLYAKFRGTASARLNLRDGRPEVSAVHSMWCLANHSCDPNVGWEWGGDVRLWARAKRVAWKGEAEGREGGIKKGEEILNHYCDVDLGLQERREWAVGALGGFVPQVSLDLVDPHQVDTGVLGNLYQGTSLTSVANTMGKPPNLYAFEDVDQLAATLRSYVLQCQRAGLERHGAFKVAVSGGSLPATLSKALLAPGDGGPDDQVHFDKWEIFFADERAVPLDHKDSNYKLLKDDLLDNIPEESGKPTVHMINTDYLDDVQEMADEYEQSLVKSFAAKDSVKLPIFDLLLLGCGPDGHTCSLFPNHPLLRERDAWVAPIEDSPKPPAKRITLTLSVVTHGVKIAFVATGEGKKDILRQIFDSEEGQGLPCGLVNEGGAEKVSWFTDKNAVDGVQFPKRGSL